MVRVKSLFIYDPLKLLIYYVSVGLTGLSVHDVAVCIMANLCLERGQWSFVKQSPQRRLYGPSMIFMSFNLTT